MSAYSIRLHIPRDAQDLKTAKALAEVGVATLAESQEKRGLCHEVMRPIQQGVCVAGTAITVLSPAGDNLMIHAAVEACRPGDLLVVATLAPSLHGAFGELLALACRARGVVGAVLETAVRDTQALRMMGFPVWARGVFAGGTVKASPGWVNAPMVVGGVAVTPGDFVVADDDGIVIVPRADRLTVLDRAIERTTKEASTRERIRRGELSLDFYQLRPLLETLGVNYEAE